MCKLNYLEKLIVLVGGTNAGKSTTLQYMANCTMHIFGYSRKNQYYQWEVNPVGGAFPFLAKPNSDNQYVLEKNFKGGNMIVGISTYGDSDSCIDSGFDWFEKHKCDVGVIASKTRGSSMNQVELVASQNGIKPIYVYLPPKDVISARSRTDIETDTADYIVKILERV